MKGSTKHLIWMNMAILELEVKTLYPWELVVGLAKTIGDWKETEWVAFDFAALHMNNDGQLMEGHGHNYDKE